MGVSFPKPDVFRFFAIPKSCSSKRVYGVDVFCFVYWGFFEAFTASEQKHGEETDGNILSIFRAILESASYLKPQLLYARIKLDGWTSCWRIA